jgi:hypothetical protein
MVSKTTQTHYSCGVFTYGIQLDSSGHARH